MKNKKCTLCKAIILDNNEIVNENYSFVFGDGHTEHNICCVDCVNCYIDKLENNCNKYNNPAKFLPTLVILHSSDYDSVAHL